MMDARYEKEAAVGRRICHLENAGPANGRGFPKGDVDIGQLRGRIVVEQIFVMLAREQVFPCWHRRGFTEALLNDRPNRDAGFGRRDRKSTRLNSSHMSIS